ncbi:hypothetical protein DF185_23175, partial [Marinifilum breve]
VVILDIFSQSVILMFILLQLISQAASFGEILGKILKMFVAHFCTLTFHLHNINKPQSSKFE